MPSVVARLDKWRSGDKSLLVDTVFRGLLGTALFAVAPFVSDVYRLWRRSAGLVPGGFSPGQFEYPPLSALYWAPFPRFPSATWAVVANGLVMTLFAVGVTWLLVYARRSGLSPDIRFWAASPALIFFLPIGWDVAVALFALAGVILVGVGRFRSAGAALSLGAVFKIFPGAAILPLLPLIPGVRPQVASWRPAWSLSWWPSSSTPSLGRRDGSYISSLPRVVITPAPSGGRSTWDSRRWGYR